MNDDPVVQDRPGLGDGFLAVLAGIVFGWLYYRFTVTGLDPSVWEDAAVAAGLRPPANIFPGFWRLVAKSIFEGRSIPASIETLSLLGAITGGVTVMLFYGIVRRMIAFLFRLRRRLGFWRPTASFVSLFAAAAFGLSDSMWRMSQTLSPDGFRFFLVMFSASMFIRLLFRPSHGRIFLIMFLTGLVSAESPFGFLIPVIFLLGYAAAWRSIADGNFVPEAPLDIPREMPKWRMFLLFLLGLAVGVTINCRAFSDLGGMDANQWEFGDLIFHYAIGYFSLIANSGSILGWLLMITMCALPMAAIVGLFPSVTAANHPMSFRRGVVMFFLALDALLMIGVIPLIRLGSIAKGAISIDSWFLSSLFAAAISLTAALAALSFAVEIRYRRVWDDDQALWLDRGRRSILLQAIVPLLLAAALYPAAFLRPNEAIAEAQSVVEDALKETIREAGDSRFVFTDGRLDAGLELFAAAAGSQLKPLDMMSGVSPREKYLRTRHFNEDEPDFETAETGAPTMLRVWAGERSETMKEAALQLGFEFWKRERLEPPKSSGILARTEWPSEEERLAGVTNGQRLAERAIKVLPQVQNRLSKGLERALSSVSWRLSRIARQRDEDRLADSLDNENGAVKKMMSLIQEERQRVFMQLTPREGLRLALARADFTEARRYSQNILARDEDDPHANFGTGMAFLMEERLPEAELYLTQCLKKRPKEPAVINNLSIIYRKTGRYAKALEFARRAKELMPDNKEILKTLIDAEAAAEKNGIPLE